MPTISIITPTYNRPQTLRRAYASMVSQSFRKWEWIIVDDGSQVPYASEIADADARVCLVSFRNNQGKGAARNAGIQRAEGLWIGFLDDDDELLPHALASLLATVAKHDNARAIYRGSMMVTRAGNKPRRVTTDYQHDSLWVQYLFTIGNIFPWIGPREDVKSIAFVDSPVFQDADYFLRLAASLPIVSLDEVLGIYHLSGPSGTANTHKEPNEAAVLKGELHALATLFSSSYPRIQQFRREGIYATAQAARYCYHASTFPSVSLVETWKRALKASRHPQSFKFLLRLTYLRLEHQLPIMKYLRRSIT